MQRLRRAFNSVGYRSGVHHISKTLEDLNLLSFFEVAKQGRNNTAV